LDKRFRRKFAPGFDGASEAIIQVWDRTKQRWLDRQEHFGDNETFSGWISGDAPASTPREVCQYYL
ncbi:hypothetical protein Z052_11940, partial [Halorubrum sp. C191]|uniref:hypothetical protein n=1 Tax=Halorubrum sp. C191 TaxID=1383842 RepID=UPI000C11037F